MRDSGPILLPLDGSELSEGAVAYAGALARGLRTHLVLLTTWEGADTDLAATLPQMVVDIDRKAQEHFGAYLERVREKLPEGIETQVIVRSGDASREILAAAESLGARMIVLATHGRSGIGRWLYGSTASHILHNSNTPVVAVGPNALQKSRASVEFKRIMLPLDGSDLSEAAIPVGDALGKALGARVSLVRVVQWAVQAYPYTLPDTYIPQVDQELESAAKKYLREREADVKGAQVDAFVVRGAIADGLIDFIDREGVDLVVMTTNARKGLARAALGSVADRLLQSSAPVLLIRPIMRSARAFAALLLAGAIATSLVACSDDDDGDDASPTARSTTAGATAAATTSASTPGATDAASIPVGTPTATQDEVRGIVGAVNADERTIEITRLSGAEVTRIAVQPSTTIRKARGGTATLAEIRPSDRIIASGAVVDGALEATEITVEAVVPGAAPGG